VVTNWFHSRKYLLLIINIAASSNFWAQAQQKQTRKLAADQLKKKM